MNSALATNIFNTIENKDFTLGDRVFYSTGKSLDPLLLGVVVEITKTPGFIGIKNNNSLLDKIDFITNKKFPC